MTTPRIVFVYPGWKTQWPNAETLTDDDIELAHSRFRRGIDIWILQGYVRLKPRLGQVGIEVSISDEFVNGAICIAHRDDLARYRRHLWDCYLVGVRADRPRLEVAAFEVVQNGLEPCPNARFIPSWPQPGILPRLPERSTAVRRVAYLGRCDSAPSWYIDGTLRDSLGKMDIELELREDRWNDYSGIDVVIAHRDESPIMLREKPAAKLVNAWRAGVPAVLGPEPAYRELALSPIDYVETRDARETAAAIEMLRNNAWFYNAMVESGRRRASEFGVEQIASRWLQFLTEVVIPEWLEWKRNRGSVLARYGEFLAKLARQKWGTRVFRAKHLLQRREIWARQAGNI